DAGDVEAHDPGSLLGDLHVVLVGLPRPVDGDAPGRHVAGLGQLDEGVLGRDVVQTVALLPQELDGRVVELDLREHLLVADPTAGVGVRLLHERSHRLGPVADDVGRDALGYGDHVSSDHQDPVVVPGDVALHHHLATPGLLQGPGEAAAHILLTAEVERDSPSVVAVDRLRDHWNPDALGRRHRGVLGPDDLPSGNGKARRREQPPGHVLVACDVYGQ